MKVYLVRERKNINAVGEYDMETKALTVKKEAVFQKALPIQKNLEGQRRLKKIEPEQ